MRSIVRRTAAAVALLTLPALAVSVSAADAAPTHRPAAVTLYGDDNHDGILQEEESGWNCTTLGNHQCGTRARLAVKACTRPTAMVGRSTRRHAIRLTHVPAALMPACLKLGQRPARRTAETYDPAGHVLVIECRMQGLTRTELGFCLRQP